MPGIAPQQVVGKKPAIAADEWRETAHLADASRLHQRRDRLACDPSGINP